MLLALSRGTGVAGLAAMPRQWERASIPWFRPLLGVPGEELRSWLQQHQVTWIEDPSNSDARYTRNRIRSQLLPALQAVFPAFRATFVRSSEHAAEADALLRELAVDDLARIGVPPVISALQRLSRARQSNVLRHWLLTHHQTTPAAAQLAELQRQIASCTTRGHKIHLKVGRGYVERESGGLNWREA
jgi:tRNA(Ile)-lysidine synthase